MGVREGGGGGRRRCWFGGVEVEEEGGGERGWKSGMWRCEGDGAKGYVLFLGYV